MGRLSHVAHEDLDDDAIRRYAAAAAAGWLAFAAAHALAGRPWTAVAHVAAGLASAGARWLVGPSPARRVASIVTLAVASLGGLGAVAVVTGNPSGPAVTLLALVPLLTGVLANAALRRTVLALALAAIAITPMLAGRVTPLEPLRVGVVENSVLSVLLGLFVYRFGSEWRVRSDAQVARLTKQQEELEAQRARVEASTTALEAVRDEALRASAAKSRFVAMTSHEIRGPLNGLVGLSHALSDTELSPHQRGIVDALRSSSDALTKVVGDLLDLARVEAGKVELAPSLVDLRELVADVADTFSAGTLEKDLEVVAVVDDAVPDGLLLDGLRLRQVLSNLVGNAVKFTDRGHVLVTGRAEEGTLVLSVSDTGRGISPEDRERLFSPFEQVSDRLLDRQAGTGLGLWLARSFVEAMGGTLEVRSDLGAGSTFEIRIPCQRATVHELDRASVLPSATLLGVTASPHVGRALGAAASRLGLEPTVVRAEGELPAGPFDHVLVDVDAPALEARISEAVRRAGGPARTYLAASPRRIARAEDLARRHKLGGVLLKPVRAARLSALVSSESTSGKRQSAQSGQLLVGTLLVVDDEPINRTVARHLATPLGLSVAEAASGAEALAWLETHPCDVVLLDLHMEGMDGAETATRIRAAHGPTPSLVGYSGVVHDEERARFQAAGVSEVLGKPLERTTFVTALRAAVGRARRRRTHQSQAPEPAHPRGDASPQGALSRGDGHAPRGAGRDARGSGDARSGGTPPSTLAAAALAGLPARSAAAVELRAHALGLRDPAPAPALAIEEDRLRELAKFVGAARARQLARETLAELDERAARVTAAARTGRARDAREAAHKLAGVAATFGLGDLATACRTIETDAVSASAATLADLATRVEGALGPSRAALARAIERWPD